jgi:hypothetical protein
VLKPTPADKWFTKPDYDRLLDLYNKTTDPTQKRRLLQRLTSIAKQYESLPSLVADLLLQ